MKVKYSAYTETIYTHIVVELIPQGVLLMHCCYDPTDAKVHTDTAMTNDKFVTKYYKKLFREVRGVTKMRKFAIKLLQQPYKRVLRRQK